MIAENHVVEIPDFPRGRWRDRKLDSFGFYNRWPAPWANARCHRLDGLFRR